MLALTDQPHGIREFTNQTFRAMIAEFGDPILAGTIVDLTPPSFADMED